MLRCPPLPWLAAGAVVFGAFACNRQGGRGLGPSASDVHGALLRAAKLLPEGCSSEQDSRDYDAAAKEIASVRYASDEAIRAALVDLDRDMLKAADRGVRGYPTAIYTSGQLFLILVHQPPRGKDLGQEPTHAQLSLTTEKRPPDWPWYKDSGGRWRLMPVCRILLGGGWDSDLITLSKRFKGQPRRKGL